MKQKGITLIALVITIIVLLILAGIGIVSLTGENGIIKRAEEAKNKSQESEKEEQNAIENLETILNSINNGNTEETPDKPIEPEEPVGPEIPDWQYVETLKSLNYPERVEKFQYQNFPRKYASNVVGIKFKFEKVFVEQGNWDKAPNVFVFDRVTIRNNTKKLIYALGGKRENFELYIKGNAFDLTHIEDYANSYYGYYADIYVTTNAELVKDVVNDEITQYVHFDYPNQTIETHEVTFEKEVNTMKINTHFLLGPEKTKSGTINIYNDKNEIIGSFAIIKPDFNQLYKPLEPVEGNNVLLQNVGKKIKIEYIRDATYENISYNVGTIAFGEITYK